MALIDLPELPAPANTSWRKRDFGSTLEGGLGGPDQRANRLGNRWIVSIALPRMTVWQAYEWQARLNDAVEAGGARYWVRQLGLNVGGAGAARVAGSGQSGRTLSLSGMTRGYVGKTGQFISIQTGGQRFGYKLRAPMRVNDDGTANAAIEPALRIEPSTDDVVEFAKPYIEGMLADLPSENFDVSTLVDGFAFTIREAR